MDRALHIALLSRRIKLLADNDEFLLYADRDKRASLAVADGAGVADTLLLATATELDCVCASAVAKLSEGGARPSVLEVLRVLPASYKVAILYAIPEEPYALRQRLWRDGHWGEALYRHDADAMEEAVEELAGLKQRQMPRELEQFSGLMYLRVWGVPVKMSQEQERAANSADALVRGMMQTARSGGDIEAYLREWAEEQVGRPLPASLDH